MVDALWILFVAFSDFSDRDSARSLGYRCPATFCHIRQGVALYNHWSGGWRNMEATTRVKTINYVKMLRCKELGSPRRVLPERLGIGEGKVHVEVA